MEDSNGKAKSHQSSHVPVGHSAGGGKRRLGRLPACALARTGVLAQAQAGLGNRFGGANGIVDALLGVSVQQRIAALYGERRHLSMESNSSLKNRVLGLVDRSSAMFNVLALIAMTVASLGVTAVELLPIHTFVDDDRLLDKGLTNYWGYNTIGFFAPDPRYAADVPNSLREFKEMVDLFAICLAAFGITEGDAVAILLPNIIPCVVAYYANGSKELPKEYFEAHDAGVSAVLRDFRELEWYSPRKKREKRWSQDKGQAAMVAAFLQSIKSGGPALIPFAELRASTLASFAVLESLRQKAPVALEAVRNA